jgi:GT2 family glycosyltransferase
MKKIDIQILLYFSSNDLVKLLKSIEVLEKTKLLTYFHFVDQSEDTKEFAKVKEIIAQSKKNTGKNIKITLNKQPNYGFGKGHNEVYRKNKDSYGDSFIILNPDSIIHHNLIDNITKYLEQLKDVNWGLLELAQFPSEHPKYFNPQTLETNWVSGAGTVINSLAFEKIGMFDENIFMYGEDVDLSMRMRMNKYKILHLPNAKFTHLTKDTDVSKTSDFTKISKLTAELYLRYKFARDKDVEKYINLISKDNPQRKEILKKFQEMKKNLNKRTYYKNFLNSENQDYTNFRWVL